MPHQQIGRDFTSSNICDVNSTISHDVIITNKRDVTDTIRYGATYKQSQFVFSPVKDANDRPVPWTDSNVGAVLDTVRTTPPSGF